MRKLMLMTIMVLLMLAVSGTGQALGYYHPKVKMYSDKKIYELGEPVTLCAENTGKEPVSLDYDFFYTRTIIYNQDNEPVFRSPKVVEGSVSLYPGEVVSWEWDQTYATWVLELTEWGCNWVKAPNYGEQVPEGRYTAFHDHAGSCTFWIGSPDYPGASDSHRRDDGRGDVCLEWAINDHAQGREHAADS